MGHIFEELIRWANERWTAGYTPREVIALMVDLLFTDDDAAIEAGRCPRHRSGGTGGMLARCRPARHE